MVLFKFRGTNSELSATIKHPKGLQGKSLPLFCPMKAFFAYNPYCL